MSKRVLALLIITLLAIVPANSILAAEPEVSESQESVVLEDENVPTLELKEDSENGTWTVTVKDNEGNIISENSNIVGTSEEIVIDTYNSLMMNVETIASCSHVPFSHSQVLGGINHIIRGNTCTMVRYKFFKCNGCGAIVGMVPNSAVIVGTHPAH